MSVKDEHVRMNMVIYQICICILQRKSVLPKSRVA